MSYPSLMNLCFKNSQDNIPKLNYKRISQIPLIILDGMIFWPIYNGSAKLIVSFNDKTNEFN